MGYVDQNLISGEVVTYRAHLHWGVLLVSVIVAALIGALGVAVLIRSMDAANSPAIPAPVGFVLLVIGAIPLLVASIRKSSAEFAVTNKRVILKVGVVHRKTHEMFLTKVESVGVDQTIMGRIFGYGSIVVRGTGGSSEPFGVIARPLEFRRQVHEQIGQLNEQAPPAPTDRT